MRWWFVPVGFASALACGGTLGDVAPVVPPPDPGPDLEYSEWRQDDGDVYKFRPGGRVERDASRGTFIHGTEGTWTQSGRDVHIVWRAGADEDDVRVVDDCSALWMGDGEENAVRTFPIGCVLR
jgi:hypothetical protein